MNGWQLVPYQTFLPGFHGPPPGPVCPPSPGGSPRNEHLFFAVLPEPDAAARIFELGQMARARHGLRGKPIAQGRLHLTLVSLGYCYDRPEGGMAAADAVARATAASTSPFEVAFHRVGSFVGRPGHRPFVLRDDGANAALMTFQGQLWAGLGGVGRTGFTPHVTLAYDELLLAEDQVEAVRWTVNDFVLIRSYVGQSRYETVGRWRLRGGR